MNEIALTEILTVSQSLKLMWALIACVAVFAVLRLRDRLIGVDFKAVARRIQANPLASALYYGLSVIGVCLLIGLLMGR
jgi:hypothetical protein